jgi:hypothetical protein
MDQKIKNAKSTLKILGILSIILGAFSIILGAMSIGGGGVLAGEMAASGGMSSAEVETAAAVTGMVLVAGVVLLVSGIFTLLLGIFSVRASNDVSKIGPAYTLAIIDLVISVISMGLTLMNGFNPSSLMESLGTVALSAVTFWAANTIKKQA